MNTHKLECGIKGFEHNWIEVSKFKSRGEYKKFLSDAMDGNVSEWIDRLIVSCNITDLDGNTTTDPKQLNEDEFLDNLDLAVFGFVSNIVFQSYNHSLSLGNTSARLLSST